MTLETGSINYPFGKRGEGEGGGEGSQQQAVSTTSPAPVRRSCGQAVQAGSINYPSQLLFADPADRQCRQAVSTTPWVKEKRGRRER